MGGAFWQTTGWAARIYSPGRYSSEVLYFVSDIDDWRRVKCIPSLQSGATFMNTSSPTAEHASALQNTDNSSAPIVISLVSTPLGIVVGTLGAPLVLNFVVRILPFLGQFSAIGLSLGAGSIITGVTIGGAHSLFGKSSILVGNPQKIVVSILTAMISTFASLFVAGVLGSILLAILTGGLIGAIIHYGQWLLRYRSGRRVRNWLLAGLIIGGITGCYGGLIGGFMHSLSGWE